MDKLTSMQVFTKVAKTGSFAGAAKDLGISRAMVTKHVMHLENHLGARLLNRTTRSLNLTEVGSSYFERCLTIIEDIEETELAVSHLHKEPRGNIKIHTPPFFGTFHLMPAIADYSEIYPDVTFQVVLQGAVIDIIEEGVDIDIRLDKLADTSLIARKLATSDMVVCGAPKYFEKNGRPQTLEDLQHHNCLVNWTFPPRDNWEFNKPEKNTVLKVTGTVRANVAGAIRLAVINGVGIGIFPTYMVGKHLKNGHLEAVLTEFEPPSVDIHAVYPHRKHLSAKTRTFLDFFYNRFQPRPYWDDWMDDWMDVRRS
ncbi:MAG: LysR family transcriptional regulator [Methylococcales bacterium]